MKKYMLVLAMLGIMPVVGAQGYEYTNNTTQYTVTRPSRSGAYKKTSTVRKTGGYHNTINNNFYYGGQPMQMPMQRPAPVNNYDEDYVAYQKPVEQKRVVRETKPARSSQERKYFLAHPFFQPLKGRFGSVTDVSYAKNTFKFDILNASFLDIDVHSGTYGNATPNVPLLYSLSGKADISQFIVKEDLSFGLSDTLALMVMAQYDQTKVWFGDWKTNNPSPDNLAAAHISDSGLNVFGIGLQNRFVDNEEWIAMISGFFQHQKDTANTFIFDTKVGYKVDRTTLYGLARLGYSRLTNGDIYGAMVNNRSGDWMMLSYKQDVKDVVYLEGGVGAFSVLNKYTYLGGELIYGHYDWHNQLNLKGTIGFQPRESFALSLYGSMSLYDSAKDKIKQYMQYDVDPAIPGAGYTDANTGNIIISSSDCNLLYTKGDYKIKSYNEWKIGVQAILYF